MRITFYTPPEKKNNHIATTGAHLVEHIAGIQNPVHINDYFNHIQDGKQEVYQTYSIFDFEGKDRNRELERLCTPLQKETYNYERRIFIQERAEEKYGYIPGLALRVSKILYGNVFEGDLGVIPSFDTLQKYHKKRYGKNQCIISDENDKIIFLGDNIRTKRTIGKDQIKKHIIKKNKTPITCICFSYTSSEHYRLAFFIYQLLDALQRYTQRYQNGIYYYDEIGFFQTRKHRIISYTQIPNLSEEFFNEFKKYFYSNCLTAYDKYWRIIDIIHGITPLTNNEYKKRIKNISFEKIQKSIRKG